MQIVGFSDVIAANKFAYLPGIGLLLPLVWVLARCWDAPRDKTRQTLSRAGIIAAITIIASGEALAARSYLSHWRDTKSLYSYMLALTPEGRRLHFGLAEGLTEEGRIDEAIEAYQKELSIYPDDFKTLNNLGALLARTGNTAEATEYFRKAVQQKPDDCKARYNLGVMLAKQAEYDEAIEHFRKAVQLRPEHANANYNLGLLLNRKGQTDKAIERFRRALEINPDFAEARDALQAALAKQQRPALQPQ